LKAIFGLGNPGPRYKGTRHNVGFEVVDMLASRWRLGEFSQAPAEALMAKRPSLDGEPVLIVKPTTFMNLSGQAVGEIVRYYRIEIGDVLIVVDEIQLPLGKLRARARGSAGGHNGLKSIIEHLGSDVPRLRLGVGRGDARRDLADHVLARFDQDEAAEAGRMIARAADAGEVFVADGIAAVMNQFNGGDPATTE
jgi:peptidyl-tRNA hydrolase, PTH1 family